MKLWCAALALGMAGCAAWGQSGGGGGITAHVCNPQIPNDCPLTATTTTEPKPLKCGKYQEEAIGQQANGYYGPVCVPLMHSVTEKEWQELMAKLKALEKDAVKHSDVTAIYSVTDGSTATDCKVPPDDPKKPCDKNQPSQRGRK